MNSNEFGAILNREEFKQIAKNDPLSAFDYLYDALEAAELNQAVILGGDGTASDEE